LNHQVRAIQPPPSIVADATGIGFTYPDRALKRTAKFIGRYATKEGIHKWKDVGNDKSSKWGVNETGRRAKFYTLTRAGRKQLTVEEESWDLLALAIAKVRDAT
jgi:hypothetical protein